MPGQSNQKRSFTLELEETPQGWVADITVDGAHVGGGRLSTVRRTLSAGVGTLTDEIERAGLLDDSPEHLEDGE